MGARRSRLRALGRAGLAVLTVAALLLTATAPLSAQPLATSLPRLRLDYYAGVTKPATFDPALVSAYNDDETIALANANLVHIVPNGTVKPDLATWTISPNHLVYTFTTRRNARFSNGHPVTAADAAFSIERSLAPSTRSPIAPGYLGLIQGAADFNAGKTKSLSGLTVVSERVLRITITKPVVYFLGALSYPTADVLDPSVVRDQPVGAPPDFKDNYLTATCSANQGAGPFMFTCRNRSSKDSFYPAGGTPVYTLVPNPYYYGRKPHVQIQLQVFPNANDDYRAYLGGRLELYDFFPTNGTPYLARWRGSREFHQYPSSDVQFLRPNTHMAPFDNVHCRLAVAYAIDRDTINSRLAQGASRSLYSLVPKGMLGYYPGTDNPHYNPTRARAELAKCPGRTVPVELKYLTLIHSHNSFAAMTDMMSRIGMNVRLKGLSAADWENVIGQPLDKTNTQLVDDGWVQDYPDPQDYCTLLLRSGQHYNSGGWHNATYDRLVDQAEVTFNRKRRAQLYIRAQHIALSQGAVIPWTNFLAFELLKPYVHGMVGTEAYTDMMPKDLDWANVSISKH